MAKTIGVDPSKVFGLQKDYSEKAHIAMTNGDEHFFLSFEAFLKADYQQKSELIERVLGKKVGEESFVVGEFFQHRNSKLIPQWFGDNFRNKVWEPAQKRTVSVGAFGKNILKDYVLPKNSTDSEIQNASNSTPMEEDQFWSMLYLLIVEPKLGKKILKYELRRDKYYVFHVALSSGEVIAVWLDWRDCEWNLNAGDFDDDDWCRDGVFLFPATSVA
ncbi:hypothetical protein K8Q94_02215 [Candidatus Nomurabacteria bacterium]|nr:hypothetical protein [Candidatus Nomurabacteria bacterium]